MRLTRAHTIAKNVRETEALFGIDDKFVHSSTSQCVRTRVVVGVHVHAPCHFTCARNYTVLRVHVPERARVGVGVGVGVGG